MQLEFPIWLRRRTNEKKELKEKINDLTLTYYVPKEAAINLIDQLDEPEKVVVPSFVARWFEEHKSSLEFAIFSAVVDVYREDETEYSKMEEWLNNEDNKPIETLVKMQDGYTVEEKKYRVLDKEGCVLIRKYGETVRRVISKVEPNQYPESERGVLALTEKEIKDYDERYWPFAEEVTE